MTRSPDISVILPALLPNDEFQRCLSSIRAALAGRFNFEIICVVGNLSDFSEVVGTDMQLIEEDELGIYGAMNKGIRNAKGRYLYFIGQDDILLPAASEAINRGLETDADLIIADVFYGQKWMYRNYSSKHFLVWKNWCHQGLFYDRIKFIEAVGFYPTQFKAQADHYANIIFSSIPGLKKIRFNGCVAWYSSDGFSSRTTDDDFRFVFPQLVYKKIGFFDYSMVVLRRFFLEMFRMLKKEK